ncbi:hypothetical protein G7Y89_g8303 [Cudoniella acicularis]|uniref:Uncharacterized protein n=1 Tax=Cudoniella acicularis TaxID=354080 RepID=A0A8H4W3P9_9HELO|nr:hypothetical protein G7Y89_g8303 [Cudoniella acicularis]
MTAPAIPIPNISQFASLFASTSNISWTKLKPPLLVIDNARDDIQLRQLFGNPPFLFPGLIIVVLNTAYTPRVFQGNFEVLKLVEVKPFTVDTAVVCFVNILETRDYSLPVEEEEIKKVVLSCLDSPHPMIFTTIALRIVKDNSPLLDYKTQKSIMELVKTVITPNGLDRVNLNDMELLLLRIFALLSSGVRTEWNDTRNLCSVSRRAFSGEPVQVSMLSHTNRGPCHGLSINATLLMEVIRVHSWYLFEHGRLHEALEMPDLAEGIGKRLLQTTKAFPNNLPYLSTIFWFQASIRSIQGSIALELNQSWHLDSRKEALQLKLDAKKGPAEVFCAF